MLYRVKPLQNSCVLLYLLFLVLSYSTATPLNGDDPVPDLEPGSALNSSVEKLQDHIKILRDTLLLKNDKSKLESLKDILSRGGVQSDSAITLPSSDQATQGEISGTLSTDLRSAAESSTTTLDAAIEGGPDHTEPPTTVLSTEPPSVLTTTPISPSTSHPQSSLNNINAEDETRQEPGQAKNTEVGSKDSLQSATQTVPAATLINDVSSRSDAPVVTYTVTQYLPHDGSTPPVSTSQSQDMHILPVTPSDTTGVTAHPSHIHSNGISSEQYDHLMKVLQEVKSKVSEQEKRAAEKLELERMLEEREQVLRQRQQMQREAEIRMKVEQELKDKFQKELEIQRKQEEEHRHKIAEIARKKEEIKAENPRSKVEEPGERQGGQLGSSQTYSELHEQPQRSPTLEDKTDRSHDIGPEPQLEHKGPTSEFAATTTMSILSTSTPLESASTVAPRAKSGSSLKRILNQKNPSYKLSVEPQFKYHDKMQNSAKQSTAVYAKPRNVYIEHSQKAEEHSPSQSKTENLKSEAPHTSLTRLPSSSSHPVASTSPHTAFSSRLQSTSSPSPPVTARHPDNKPSLSQRLQNPSSKDPKYSFEKQPGEDTFEYFERIFPDLKVLMEEVHAENVKASKTHTHSSTQRPTKSEEHAVASSEEILGTDGVIYEYVYEDEPVSPESEYTNEQSSKDDPSSILHVPKELQEDASVGNNPFATFKSNEELRSSYLKQQLEQKDQLSGQDGRGSGDKHHKSTALLPTGATTNRHKFKYQPSRKKPQQASKSELRHGPDFAGDPTEDTSSSKRVSTKSHRPKRQHHRKHRSGAGDGIDFDVFGLGDAHENGAQQLSMQYCSSYVAAITLIAAGLLLYL